VVPSPNVGTGRNHLFAISVRGPHGVWAVGRYAGANGQANLVEHYDGTSWSVDALPTGKAAPGSFSTIDPVGSRNLLAGGYIDDGYSEKGDIKQYNGTSWKKIRTSPLVHPDASDWWFARILSFSQKNAWAVGGYDAEDPYTSLYQYFDGPIVAHFDGKKWSPVSFPYGPGPRTFDREDGVVNDIAGSNSTLWIVGQSFNLGPMLELASKALSAVCKPEKVYVCSFGEAHRHVHFYVLPRTARMPATGPDLFWQIFEEQQWACSDEDAAAVAGRVRSEIEKLQSEQPQPPG
jgi:hypothetical protein